MFILKMKKKTKKVQLNKDQQMETIFQQDPSLPLLSKKETTEKSKQTWQSRAIR